MALNSVKKKEDDRNSARREECLSQGGITQVVLTNFRNYASLFLKCETRPIILTGPNGVGKTNILEALSLLAPGRGLRGAALSDFIRFPETALSFSSDQRSFSLVRAGSSDSWIESDREAERDGESDPSVRAAPNANALQGYSDDSVVSQAAREQAFPEGLKKAEHTWGVAISLDPSATGDLSSIQIGTGLMRTLEGRERRVVQIEGKVLSTQTPLTDYISVLWITPHMNRLFVEGASSRRRFLDRLVQGQDGTHAARLGRYENAMRERARLLRMRELDPSWLRALEEQMASETVAIAAARLDLVRRLEAAKLWALTQFPRPRLRILGYAEERLMSLSALEVEEALSDLLAKNRERDRDQGQTHSGAHRSDLDVFFENKALPAAFCSTGEQKALLVSIVMAAARLQVLQRKGGVPLLLLDDVVAHLDTARQEDLFHEILNLKIQAWMTGTETSCFSGLHSKAQHFQVRQDHRQPQVVCF